MRDQSGLPVEANIAQMVEVASRRVEWTQLLGTTDNLRQVILASGGHLRDLFRILQEIITSAHGRQTTLPVDQAQVEEAITVVARDFSGITKENGACLRRIDQELGRFEPAAGEVDRLARLLDTYMLLAHLNGETWYEVHPLARRTLGLG